MANPDRPSGFTPVGTMSGAPWQGLVRRGQMGNADGTDVWDDIFIGDPVAFDQSDANKIIPHFTSVADCIGVCVGVGYVGSGNSANEAGMFNVANLEKRWGDSALADTDTIWIYYAPAGDTIFEIQSNSDLDIEIGDQCDHSCATGSGTHGSETTSMSTVELEADGDTDVYIVGIPEYPDNDKSLANARYHVIFFDQAFRATGVDNV